MSRARVLAVAALLLGGLALGVHGALTDTPTVDEYAHLPAGCALLVHGTFDFYAENPPLAKMLMAAPVVLAGARVPRPETTGGEWAPWIYGQTFFQANRERYLHLFFLGRTVILGLWLFGGLLVWRFGAALFGEDAGVGAVLLYVLCPNLEAHGRLATLDAASATSILAVFFCLERALFRPAPWRFAVTGVVLGLAILVKFTALLALPAVAILVLAGGGAPEVSGGRGRLLGRAALRLAGVLAVALAVVNSGYGWRGSFEPAGRFGARSAFARRLVRYVPSAVPVPLPRALVEGFDSEKLRTERGEFGTYLEGRWWPRAPRTYEAVAFLVKTPEPVLVLLVLAAAGLALRRTGLRAAGRVEAFCWLPPLSLLVLLAAFSELKTGIRYLLPALPFVHLGLARWFADFRIAPRPSARSCVAAAAAVSLAAVVACTHPAQLSYFNHVAGGPARGHEWLADSNLDWGQDLSRVGAYLRAHGIGAIRLLYFGHVEPGLYGLDYRLPGSRPEPGTYVVSANFALGATYVAPDHGRMVAVRGAPEWIRARRPDARIGGSLWVYEIR